MKVILIIVAVILVLLMIRIKAHIVYDGELAVRVSVCGIWMDLIPRRRKPIKLRDWTKKAVEKREKKELKRAEKRKAAEARKKAEAEAKKAKKESGRGEKSAHAAGSSGEETGKKKHGLKFYMKFVRIGIRVLKKLIKKLRSNISYDISRLWIKVAGAEPDKTANTYGIISGSVSGALAFLGEKGRVRYSAPEGYDAVYVEADFIAEKTDFIIDVKVGTSVGKVLGIVNGVIGSAIAGAFREFVINKDG